MKKCRWYLQELKWIEKFAELYLTTRWMLLTGRELLFLVGTGCHGNIGDLAIAEAEYRILKYLFPDKKVVEINSNLLKRHTKKFIRIIGNHIVFIQGGGFIGTLWREEDIMAKKVIQTFRDNLIIVFPQTIYFEKSDYGRKIYEETCEIYQKHKRLLLCLRERISFELGKNILDDKRIMLLPDVVLSLKFKYKPSKVRNGVLFCLRKDKEKLPNEERVKEIRQCLYECLGNDIKICNTDMVLSCKFKMNKREKYIQQKLEEFSGAKLIVTDRLHGMVFSVLTNTPCIVIDNCNYKVRGVYEWINQYKNILYVSEYDDIKYDDIIRIVNTAQEYNADMYLHEFRKLVNYVESRR